MKSNWLTAVGVLAVLLLARPGVVAAQGDAEAGQIKAIPCMGCHGIPGYYNVYPTYRVPRIGGQHAKYLAAALRAYRDGSRNHKTMVAQAATLSDRDIEDISAYLESFKDN